MSELLQPGHPDADELNAFLERALPPDARRRTLEHLAGCSECRTIVALAVEPEVVPEAVVVARPWWRRPLWAIVLPLAVAGTALFFVMHRASAPGAVEPAPVQQARLEAPVPSVTVQQPAAPVAQQAVAGAIALPKPPLAVAKGESVAALPAAGRDISGFSPGAAPVAVPVAAAPAATTPAAQPPRAAAMGGMMAAAPAAAPRAAVTASAQAYDAPIVTGASLDALSDDPHALAAELRALHPLPSGLPAVSEAAGAGAMVAVDGANHVFVTRDAGAHWVAVPAQWGGRAVRVGLTAAAAGGAGAAVSVDADSNASATVISGEALAPMAAWSSVTGVVTDPTGATIPGATVTVQGPHGAPRKARTDASGRYAVAGLAAGNYSMVVEKPGFGQTTIAVAVSPRTALNQNVKLAVGSESTVIEVQSANAMVATEEVAPAAAKRKSAAKPAPMPAPMPAPAQPVFELTTDGGQNWVSADGSLWVKKPK